MVEDDFEIIHQLERILKNAKRFDCKVTTARSGKEGFEYLEEKLYDVVLSEYDMPDMGGIDFLKKVREKYPAETMRFLIIDEGETKRANEALNDGVIHQYIENP
ncbi:MAG: response regulator, partial [Candidatus Thermoplasmatota archaeon]|nr:response regulator [Candidatus Thermoplasmatota archaeon]MBS3790458.1 response regulator [Candidatus Thermoplasmatota archaeon]